MVEINTSKEPLLFKFKDNIAILLKSLRVQLTKIIPLPDRYPRVATSGEPPIINPAPPPPEPAEA